MAMWSTIKKLLKAITDPLKAAISVHIYLIQQTQAILI